MTQEGLGTGSKYQDVLVSCPSLRLYFRLVTFIRVLRAALPAPYLITAAPLAVCPTPLRRTLTLTHRDSPGFPRMDSVSSTAAPS